MADSIYTFYPNFKEFLPLYRGVLRVWMGDGKNTGTSGVIYAEYEDGTVTELGSASMYAVAVANGYTGTEAQWTRMILGVASLVKGATADIAYMTTTDGVNHPDPESQGWAQTPTPEKGKYVWTKIDLKWIDSTTTTIYTVSYQGNDGPVESVNGSVGNIILRGDNIIIDENSETTIKQYIDNLVFEPEIATKEDIDAIFATEVETVEVPPVDPALPDTPPEEVVEEEASAEP